VCISLDGFDLAIPIGEDNLDAVFKSSKWRISPWREIAYLYFIFERAEIRSGSFLRFDDTVRHWANDESNFSNKVSTESNWPMEESQTLGLLISKFPKDLFRHFSVFIKSFHLDCRQRDDELVCMLRYPIHLELLLSFPVISCARWLSTCKHKAPLLVAGGSGKSSRLLESCQSCVFAAIFTTADEGDAYPSENYGTYSYNK